MLPSVVYPTESFLIGNARYSCIVSCERDIVIVVSIGAVNCPSRRRGNSGTNKKHYLPLTCILVVSLMVRRLRLYVYELSIINPI